MVLELFDKETCQQEGHDDEDPDSRYGKQGAGRTVDKNFEHTREQKNISQDQHYGNKDISHGWHKRKKKSGENKAPEPIIAHNRGMTCKHPGGSCKGKGAAPPSKFPRLKIRSEGS